MDCDHGWLHTGDLPLNIPDVWQAFEGAWNAHINGEKICALTAPHHGSPNGHNPSLYTHFKPAAVIFSTGWSSTSKPGSPVYSHRNAPRISMREAALNAVVVELNNI